MLRDFNARLHTRLATEEHRLGEYIFEYTSAKPHPESNRQLLLELCGALDLVVGNTFFAQPPSRQVTVYNVGSNPYSALIPANFGQINFILTNTEASRHSFPEVVQVNCRPSTWHRLDTGMARNTSSMECSNEHVSR